MKIALYGVDQTTDVRDAEPMSISDLADFLAANSELDPSDLALVKTLETARTGSAVRIGGGAGVRWEIKLLGDIVPVSLLGLDELLRKEREALRVTTTASHQVVLTAREWWRANDEQMTRRHEAELKLAEAVNVQDRTNGEWQRLFFEVDKRLPNTTDRLARYERIGLWRGSCDTCKAASEGSRDAGTERPS